MEEELHLSKSVPPSTHSKSCYTSLEFTNVRNNDSSHLQ